MTRFIRLRCTEMVAHRIQTISKALKLDEPDTLEWIVSHITDRDILTAPLNIGVNVEVVND